LLQKEHINFFSLKNLACDPKCSFEVFETPILTMEDDKMFYQPAILGTHAFTHLRVLCGISLNGQFLEKCSFDANLQ